MDEKYFKFKKLYWSYLIGIFLFSVIAGILSLINIVPIYFNEEPYFGIQGLILAVIFTPFIAFVLSITNLLALNLGVFFYRIFNSLKKK